MKPSCNMVEVELEGFCEVSKSSKAQSYNLYGSNEDIGSSKNQDEDNQYDSKSLGVNLGKFPELFGDIIWSLAEAKPRCDYEGQLMWRKVNQSQRYRLHHMHTSDWRVEILPRGGANFFQSRAGCEINQKILWFKDDLEESGDFGVFWSLLRAELNRRVRCLAMDGDFSTHLIAEVMPILLKSSQSASREEAVEEMKDYRSTVHHCRRSTVMPDYGPLLTATRYLIELPRAFPRSCRHKR
ncbi:hypothetical protein DY000_02015754 [Brassica cretica]|uniref:Uncharacterized protein n=1 Tax=Brassica cretica TaxID=69181 RepID=A0ABQ7CLQ7_BRACR|nr:hypothetical protein DY000_02015754 [Brassica cretica]